MDFRLLLPHCPQGIGADLADPHTKFKSDGPDPISIFCQMLQYSFLARRSLADVKRFRLCVPCSFPDRVKEAAKRSACSYLPRRLRRHSGDVVLASC